MHGYSIDKKRGLIMWKNLALIFFCLMLFGCSGKHEVYLCPVVSIPRSDAYVTKNNGIYVEIYGYDAYCFDDSKRRNQTKAVISPQFKVVRNNTQEEQTVHLEYYIKLGNSVKTFEDSFTLPIGKKQMVFSGKKHEIKIRSFTNHKHISLGLVLTGNEKFYNQQTFDLGFEDNIDITKFEKVKRLPQASCSSCNL